MFHPAMMFASYRASVISAQSLAVTRNIRGVELHLRGERNDVIRILLLSAR